MNIEQKKQMFSGRDVGMKLDGTYIYYKDSYYLARVPENGTTLHLYPINENRGQKHIVKIDSEDWNIKFPKLGYYNSKEVNKAYYIARGPVRSNRVAPTATCFSIYSANGSPIRGGLHNVPHNHADINAFFKNESNIPFEEALSMLKTNESVAVNNFICLFKDSMNLTKVALKNTVIGWMSTKTKPTIMIPESLKGAARFKLIEKYVPVNIEVIKNV